MPFPPFLRGGPHGPEQHEQKEMMLPQPEPDTRSWMQKAWDSTGEFRTRAVFHIDHIATTGYENIMGQYQQASELLSVGEGWNIVNADQFAGFATPTITLPFVGELGLSIPEGEEGVILLRELGIPDQGDKTPGEWILDLTIADRHIFPRRLAFLNSLATELVKTPEGRQKTLAFIGGLTGASNIGNLIRRQALIQGLGRGGPETAGTIAGIVGGRQINNIIDGYETTNNVLDGNFEASIKELEMQGADIDELADGIITGVGEAIKVHFMAWLERRRREP